MSARFSTVIKAYDEALNQDHRSNYSLFGQVSSNGLACSIFNTLNSKFLSLEHVEFSRPEDPGAQIDAIQSFISDHPWLKGSFSAIRLFYETNKSTLVPASLFDPTDRDTLAQFNFDVPAGFEIRYDPLKNTDAVLLYTASIDLLQMMQRVFPDHRLQCHATVLIEALLALNKNQSPGKRMFVNVRDAQIDVVILEGNNLIFYNSFSYHSKQDFVYYIIFVIEQLNLNPEVIELRLSGLIEKKSTLFDMAWKYVRHIEFQEFPAAYRYSYLFNDVSPHRYFTLLNSVLCES
jgi:hypothetical protein